MAHERKNFNYETATADEVYQHFLTSSRQAIASARKTWIKDDVMTIKLNAAFYKCKLEEVKRSYEREYISYICWFNV